MTQRMFAKIIVLFFAVICFCIDAVMMSEKNLHERFSDGVFFLIFLLVGLGLGFVLVIL